MTLLRKHRGFTVIEVIIVLSLVVFLLLLAFSSLRGLQQKSRDAKRKADISDFVGAVNSYQLDFGKGPSSWNELTQNDYLLELPTDPVNSGRYVYEFRNSAPAPNNGGYARALLESTGAYYQLTWPAP